MIQIIRVSRVWLVFDSVTYTAIDPEYLGISEESIRAYLKDNLRTPDPSYSDEDLIDDLTQSSGFLSLPDDTTEETREYVANMISELI